MSADDVQELMDLAIARTGVKNIKSDIVPHYYPATDRATFHIIKEISGGNVNRS